MGGNHGQVIALRLSSFKGAAASDSTCTYLRGRFVNVLVPDTAAITTTRRYFSWWRTVGLSAAALVIYFVAASAVFFATVPI